MEPNKAKKPEEVQVKMKVAPKENNTWLYMVVAAGVILAGTIIFLIAPMISEINAKQQETTANIAATEAAKRETEDLKARINSLKTRIKAVQQTINNAMQREILPSDKEQTEFVRFLEKKVNALNTSERNKLQMDSVMFTDGVSPVDGLTAMNVKIELAGSEENFYRLLQELENSGSIIVVKQVADTSPLYGKVQEGDIVRVLWECDDETMQGECEKSPVIYSWVVLEKLQQMPVGKRGTFLEIRRFDNANNIWRTEKVEYVPTEDMPDIIDADGRAVAGQKDSGITLDLSDEYTRQISIENVSSKSEEGDPITGEGKIMKFTLDLNAYYLPQ